MSKPQLIVCGSIALDRIMNFSGRYGDLIQPDKLHVLSVSVLVDKLEDTPGGIAANITASASLLGEQAILLGSVGQNAKAYIEQLANRGVNTEFVHFSQLPTASFSVITDQDDNQVGGFYPGAMSDSDSLGLERWANQDVFVVISAHDPAAMRTQVAECQRFGLRHAYDPGQQVSNISGDDLRAGIQAAEVLIVNDYELGVLSDKTGLSSADLKSQIPIVITTLGKDGSVIEGSSVKTPIKVATAKPDKLIDPTGAGDGYRAGFLYGYLRQWELPTCGQLGSVVASFIIEHHGTQPEFTKQAIKQRYQDTFNQELRL